MIAPGLPPDGGGIGSYTEKTARILAQRGHEVHVLIRGPARSAASVQGVQVHSLPTPRFGPFVVARSWAVARALRRLGRFDIVQACEWRAEAWWFSLRPSAPLVTRLATPHFIIERLNDVPARQRRRQFLSRVLERSQARRSARVISPSRVLAGEVAAHWGIPRADIAIVPTGIRVSTVRPELVPNEIRGLRYALYFGRLEQRKGVDTWILALRNVLRTDKSLHAVFVGEDVGFRGLPFDVYAGKECRDDVERLHFLAPMRQESLFAVIAGAELVVMPSRWESLANACLEAMALGRPVVATSGSGFEEVITDGVDGFLVPPCDSATLAATASRALEDEGLRARVGDAARRRAQHYDLDAMVNRLLDVYDEVLLGDAAVPEAVGA